MKKVLVPIGSNDAAAHTLQYAVDFVEGTEAILYVIKVFGVTKVAGAIKKVDAILEQDANNDLDEIIAKVNLKGVQVISKPIKGNVSDSIQRIASQLEVSLVITSAKSNSTDDTVYIGDVAGGLIKNTDIPLLIIPKGYSFSKIDKVLMAIKSGIISPVNILNPLKDILRKFDADLDLLHVITADLSEEDKVIDDELKALMTDIRTTENATIFQGVLEHIHDSNPDLICVIRRKRGFFMRLIEKNKVYKKDFESRVPLLVLKGTT